LRIQGPDTGIEPTACEHYPGDPPDYTLMPDAFDASAIAVVDDNGAGWTVRIDNNELWGWPWAAVTTSNVYGLTVQHNHIHHNRRQARAEGCRPYGMGYGVVTWNSGHTVIEANLFDHNRHDIASDGRLGNTYEARYNLVLNGAVQHSFDVHRNPEDGSTLAGTLFYVHHNTFLQSHKPAFRIRAIPEIAACVWANEFRHIYEDDAANQVNHYGRLFVWDNRVNVNHFPAWFVSFSGASFWRMRRFDSLPMSSLLFGDFDADGTTDAFSTSGGQWRLSRGARLEWEDLTTSEAPLSMLRVGDFNGDGYADVFRKNDSKWQVSYGGWSAWSLLNTSSTSLSSLGFADFDGDQRTDVFYGDGSTWYVSWGGTSGWSYVNTSEVTAGSLRFADFNGDGRADVFRADGSHWWVSWGGTTAWQMLNTSEATLSSLGFGDFDGDGRADVFRASGSHWYISRSGTTAWEWLNTSSLTMQSLIIGDFNGDRRADVLSRQDP
jgi:hypothetical protein